MNCREFGKQISDDVDNNGEIDIKDIIILALKTPGIHVDRESFLKHEFCKEYSQETIDSIIQRTPALACILSDKIDKIADDVIDFERAYISGTSTLPEIPDGAAMAATIPADVIQYYGCTLRAVQKLLYLYRFPDLKMDDNGIFPDSETMNEIILCLGVMNDVPFSDQALKAIVKVMAGVVEKNLLNIPRIKTVVQLAGITLTKKVFAESFKNAIPGKRKVFGGDFVFLSFKRRCYRLVNVLKGTNLSNPGHTPTPEVEIFVNEVTSDKMVNVDDDDIIPENEPFTEEELNVKMMMIDDLEKWLERYTRKEELNDSLEE